MSEQKLLPCLDPRPVATWPAWFRPSKYAAYQARYVARGLHPMGARLRPGDETCATCAHLEHVRAGASAFYKCARARQSRGPATDVRRKWPACELWEPVQVRA